jgi:anti-sigma regulatory factor (Ser/Thr protein kinase)
MIEPAEATVGTVPFVALEVDPVPASVGRVRRRLMGFATAHGADAVMRSNVGLAVSEAMTNAVVHGHRRGLVPGRIHVAADVEDGALEVVVCDSGNGIRPGTSSTGLGLGLAFIAEITARFEVREQVPRGTEVWMRFVLA